MMLTKSFRVTQRNISLFNFSRATFASERKQPMVKQPMAQELETLKRRLREEKQVNSTLKGEIKQLKGELRQAQKQGKKKTKKDPNAPKRPLSAYLIYANEVRDQVAREVEQQVGKYDVGTIGKRIGEMWKGLGDAEKEQYFAKQNDLRREYEDKKADYERDSARDEEN